MRPLFATLALSILFLASGAMAQTGSTPRFESDKVAEPGVISSKDLYQRGKMPEVTHFECPDSTKLARKLHVSGETYVTMVVDEHGSVRDAQVSRSLADGLDPDHQKPITPEIAEAAAQLDEKAVEAVRKFRFSPGELNGKPIAVRMNLHVRSSHP